MITTIRACVAGAFLASITACSDFAREVPTGESEGASVATDADAGQSFSVATAAARSEPAASANSDQAPPQALADAIGARMLIRNGTASVEVDTLERGIAAVRALAARVGGSITNVSLQTGDDRNREAMLTIRLPAERFEDAINGLRPIGDVKAVNVTSEDVGEEYVDVQMRVANARRLEERLLELLATRTGTLEHVLTVERELARVREQIERQEGRLRYLRNRVDLSTLTVTVREPGAMLADSWGQNVIARSFRQSVRNFIGFVGVLIASLGVVLPLAALGWIGWLVYRRVPRARPVARQQTAESPAGAD